MAFTPVSGDTLPQIALLVSDLDGTLVRPDKSLSPATIAAVQRLQASGLPVTLISARPPRGMRYPLKALGLDLPYGAFNGGTIVNADGSVAVAHRITESAARTALALFAKHPVDIWVFVDDQWLLSKDEGEFVARERVTVGYGPVVVKVFDGYADRIDKIVAVSGDHASLAVLETDLKALLGNTATVARSQPYYLDVTDVLANKGDGVAALAAAIGVSLQQTAVIGDAANDVPMFARAGLAIAMGQAEQSVKDRAALVTSSNTEDGVAAAIDRWLMR